MGASQVLLSFESHDSMLKALESDIGTLKRELIEGSLDVLLKS